MKENNQAMKQFEVLGQPLPKPRMARGTKWYYNKTYWNYLNSASEIVWAEMKKNKWKGTDLDVSLSCWFYRKGKKRADLDNMVKTILEICQKVGLVKNDSQITYLKEIGVSYEAKEPKTIFEVW